MRARAVTVVHSFDFYTNILALPAARLAGVRTIIGSQRNLGNLRSPAQQAIHDLCLRLATHVHVNSEAVRERVLQVRGISRERLTVIPNGVDLGRFSPLMESPRHDTGLVVGALSNLRPEKGLVQLLHAVATVRERWPEVRLVIWGEGSQRHELEGLVASLNLAASVKLPGSTEFPEVALRDLDVFVLPSLSEACSNGLMEAMATALPVIATSVGGNPEHVDDEINGLLVPPGDSTALAKAIARLVEDRAWAARLGQQARAYAQSMLGMDRMVTRTEALYVQALGRAKSR
jgi:glycosyltransferase involved in cell wall biosynthesis